MKIYAIENMCFEGGGVLGIAYASALQKFFTHYPNVELKRVAGTSAGSIVAFLLSLGYTPKQIEDAMLNTNFSQFQDGSFGFFRDIARLLHSYGVYKGEVFKNWAYDFIVNSGVPYMSRKITFSDLRLLKPDSPSLYIVGTNLTKERTEIFSHETTPDMLVVDALRISMCIPMFFTAVKHHGDIYIDGGVLRNYPVSIFDSPEYIEGDVVDYDGKEDNYNTKTLGFRLDSDDEIRKVTRKKSSNIVQYILRIIELLHSSAQKSTLKEQDKERTVIINTGKIGATEFGLSSDDIMFLLKTGENAISDFIGVNTK